MSKAIRARRRKGVAWRLLGYGILVMGTGGWVGLGLADQGVLDHSIPVVDGDGNGAVERPFSVLDAVVVTANRSSTRRFESPYSIDVVDQKEVEEGLRQKTPDLLAGVPGVMVQKTSVGQGSPFIRGFTGFRTLMLIDGIRLNNAVFRDGPNQYWNMVDPFTIGRLEVVKGPASVLYGSDAIGGTVNAITKTPGLYGEGIQHQGRVFFRASSGERATIGRGEIEATVDGKVGVVAGVTGKLFDDVVGGEHTGLQPGTGYDEYDGDAKIEYRFHGDARLVFAYQRVRQNNVPRTHATVDAVSFLGTAIGTDKKRDLDQKRELAYVQVHAERIGEWIDTFAASVSWHVQNEDEDRVTSSSAMRLQGFEDGQLGFGVQLGSTTPVGKLVYGVEYYRDNVSSYSNTSVIQGPVADDASYDTLGLFVQDTVEAGEDWEFIFGGRYNFAAAEAGSVRRPTPPNDRITISKDWDSFVGSGRAVWKIDRERHWSLFGGVSQGFRSPNLSDLSRFDIARSGELETPSPDLEPERFVSFEGGVKSMYEAWSMQAAYFYTVIEDMIVRAPTGNIVGGAVEVTKRNGGDGFIHGVELGVQWRFDPPWTINGLLSWTEGQVDQFPGSSPASVREAFSRAQPLSGRVGLRWEEPELKLWVEGTVTVVSDADRLTTADRLDTQRIPSGGTPGYTVLGVHGGWKVSQSLTVYLGVENLTNVDYRVHGSGSNEPGINLVGGFDYRF